MRTLAFLLFLFPLFGLSSCETESTDAQNENQQTALVENQPKEGNSPSTTSASHDPLAKDLQEGENTLYYPSGKVRIKGEIVAGKRHGVWTSWYENGMKWSEDTYNYGVREGKTVSFYTNGQVRYLGNFQGDKKVGIWQFFDEEGNLTKKEEYTK